MTERVSIRRHLKAGVVVNVTLIDGDIKVHWAERVLGPTPRSIHGMVAFCRRQCEMLMDGMVQANQGGKRQVG